MFWLNVRPSNCIYNGRTLSQNQGLGVGVGSRWIFGGKESGVGKPRESDSGVGNFENLSRRSSRESVGFLG